jgi:hypothetical protein
MLVVYITVCAMVNCIQLINRGHMLFGDYLMASLYHEHPQTNWVLWAGDMSEQAGDN